MTPSLSASTVAPASQTALAAPATVGSSDASVVAGRLLEAERTPLRARLAEIEHERAEIDAESARWSSDVARYATAVQAPWQQALDEASEAGRLREITGTVVGRQFLPYALVLVALICTGLASSVAGMVLSALTLVATVARARALHLQKRPRHPALPFLGASGATVLVLLAASLPSILALPLLAWPLIGGLRRLGERWRTPVQAAVPFVVSVSDDAPPLDLAPRPWDLSPADRRTLRRRPADTVWPRVARDGEVYLRLTVRGADGAPVHAGDWHQRHGYLPPQSAPTPQFPAVAAALPPALSKVAHSLISAIAAFTPGWPDHERAQRRAALDAEAQDLTTRMERLDAIVAAWRGLQLPESVLAPLLGGLRLLLRRDPAAPSGTLLSGPPGTGKTELARRLAQAGGVPLVITSASALKAGHVGGTEERVRALWQDLRAKAPCILFLDECDAVLPDRTAPATDAFGRAMTESFLAEWQGQGDGIWVIGTTNRRERIDTAILSRFGDQLEVPLPDRAARAALLTDLFAEHELGSHVPDALVSDTSGRSGRDLVNFVRGLRREHLAAPDVPVATLAERLLQTLRRDRGTRVRSVTWEQLVLAPTLIGQLQTTALMLRSAETLVARGLSVPRGLLLVGPPGTGKTQIARALATEAGLGFLAFGLSDLKGGYTGHSGALVHSAFEQARAQAPCIMFLDEIETMTPTRGTGDSFTDEIVAQMLVELDGVAADDRFIFLLAATNRIDRIDPAIRSRLPESLDIGLPGPTERRGILAVLLKGKPVAFADPERTLSAIAAATEGLSGRDLRSLVERAERHAITRAAATGRIDTAALVEADFMHA